MTTALPAVGPAVAALEGGGVVGLPTDTVYGLAARASEPDACRALFALKGRPEGVALPVLVADLAQAGELAAEAALDGLGRLAASFWPGPLTVVVARREGLCLELGGDPGSVGLRCPAEELLRRICRRVGPIATTSANRHGGAPCHEAAEVRSLFGAGLAEVLDGGRRAGRPSTVVSLLAGRPAILRPGAVSLEEVHQALGG